MSREFPMLLVCAALYAKAEEPNLWFIFKLNFVCATATIPESNRAINSIFFFILFDLHT